ncbi:hypothetical protein [Nonomuraea sp. NPDC049480]|uniref:hypothetical protein n=1 Tax=Nonomuraea sp. NPDC049480 TaxID=3364353 RepID=UPI003795CFB5
MELLLRFILSHQDLHSLIVGSTQLAHVQANVAAAQKGPLPTDVYDALRPPQFEVGGLKPTAASVGGRAVTARFRGRARARARDRTSAPGSDR